MRFSGSSKVLILVGASAVSSCEGEVVNEGASTDSGTDASPAGAAGNAAAAGRGGGSGGGTGGSGQAGFGGTRAVGGVGGADAGTMPGDASSDVVADAARTCSGTCAAFCTNVISQNCSDPAPVFHDRVACEAECSKHDPWIAADCGCSFKNYLECAAVAGLQCPRLRCSDAGFCVDESMKVLGCDAEAKAFDSCAGACLRSGNESGGSSLGDAEPRESYLYESTRCECPPLVTGLPAGSSCEFADECAQFCCDCPSDRGKFVGQLCVAGRCAGPAEGCSFGKIRPFGMCRSATP